MIYLTLLKILAMLDTILCRVTNTFIDFLIRMLFADSYWCCFSLFYAGIRPMFL